MGAIPTSLLHQQLFSLVYQRRIVDAGERAREASRLARTTLDIVRVIAAHVYSDVVSGVVLEDVLETQ